MPAIIWLSRHPPQHDIFSPWMWWVLYASLAAGFLMLLIITYCVLGDIWKEWRDKH